jgi:hypothetical protein
MAITSDSVREILKGLWRLLGPARSLYSPDQMETPMKLTLFVVIVGISLFSRTAQLNAQVRTDYDHSATFANYKTYSWLKVQAGDSLWNDLLQQDVDAQLAYKGWTKSESGADAMVSAFRGTQNEQTLQTFYDGFGGRWRWRGFNGGDGLATTTTEVTKVGNVVVDIFDVKSQTLLWRGKDSDDLSSNVDKNVQKLEKDIDNMFKQFPPKQAPFVAGEWRVEPSRGTTPRSSIVLRGRILFSLLGPNGFEMQTDPSPAHLRFQIVVLRARHFRGRAASI